MTRTSGSGGLAHAHQQAELLLKSFRRGTPDEKLEAVRRLQAHPFLAKLSPAQILAAPKRVQLKHAQHAVAIEEGYVSWAQLKKNLEKSPSAASATRVFLVRKVEPGAGTHGVDHGEVWETFVLAGEPTPEQRRRLIDATPWPPYPIGIQFTRPETGSEPGSLFQFDTQMSWEDLTQMLEDRLVALTGRSSRVSELTLDTIFVDEYGVFQTTPLEAAEYVRDVAVDLEHYGVEVLDTILEGSYGGFKIRLSVRSAFELDGEEYEFPLEKLAERFGASVHGVESRLCDLGAEWRSARARPVPRSQVLSNEIRSVVEEAFDQYLARYWDRFSDYLDDAYGNEPSIRFGCSFENGAWVATVSAPKWSDLSHRVFRVEDSERPEAILGFEFREVIDAENQEENCFRCGMLIEEEDVTWIDPDSGVATTGPAGRPFCNEGCVPPEPEEEEEEELKEFLVTLHAHVTEDEDIEEIEALVGKPSSSVDVFRNATDVLFHLPAPPSRDVVAKLLADPRVAIVLWDSELI